MRYYIGTSFFDKYYIGTSTAMYLSKSLIRKTFAPEKLNLRYFHLTEKFLDWDGEIHIKIHQSTSVSQQTCRNMQKSASQI